MSVSVFRAMGNSTFHSQREWNKKENPTLEREEKENLKSETFENIVDKKVQLYKNEISQ